MSTDYSAELGLYLELMNAKPDERNVNLMRGLGASLLTISCVSVLLRVWVRTRMVKCWGWDDWTILMTLATYTGEIAVLFCIANVEGKPRNLANLEVLSMLVFVEQIIYGVGAIILKISLAIFFSRFLVERWARKAVWASVIVYFVFAFAGLLVIIFECGIPGQFVVKQARGQCIPFRIFEVVAYTQGTLNALTDWLFALLPIYFLWKSQMPTTTKLSVCVIMVFAVAGSIASCVRTAWVHGIRPSINFYESSAPVLMWTAIEPGLAITAASMATLRPLLTLCVQRTKTIFSGKAGTTTVQELCAKPSISESVLPVMMDEIHMDKLDLESGRGSVKAKTIHIGVSSVSGSDSETSSRRGS